MPTPIRGTRVHSLLTAAAALLPEGRPLPDANWRRRQRVLVGVLGLQATSLLGLALLLERAPWQALALVTPLLLATVVGAATDVHRRVRTSAVAVGLVGCSLVLVNLTGGVTESHFHIFVTLAIIALYQEWLPLLIALALVTAHHVSVLLIAPSTFVIHDTEPRTWALVHGIYVVATGCAGLLAWRFDEQERTRSQRVLDATAEGIYGLDNAGGITFANAALGLLLGRNPADLVDCADHDAAGHGPPHHTRPATPAPTAAPAADLVQVTGAPCRACEAIAAAGGTPMTDITFRRLDGTAFPVELTAMPVVERGRRTGTVVSVRDLTEHIQLVDRAMRDPLTGLANRALLIDHLTKALARLSRSRDMVALLFIDLDRFKVVNDSLGHAAGDELLRAAADRLRASVRLPDTVARFGGDEFVVLCEGLSSERDVFVVAERIVEAFAAPFTVDADTDVSATASVGITVTRDPAAEPDGLLRDADAAMYRAKEGGRGRFEMFDRGIRSRALRRLETESDLWRAIARDELRVHYQPVVDLADGRITSVEALVRWEHPEKGMVPPGDFIPIAEETGLILPIGAWVLEEACRQVQQWRSEIPATARLGLAVNLSAVQLQHDGFVATVAEVLQRTGYPPHLLCLEITESVVMHDVQASTAVMEALKALGVTLAVDDFGTGYSSLAYLSRFPVDVLKVDRAFVTVLDDGAASWPIVAAITGLASALGLQTVAEGVEEPAQIQALRALGCDLAQGFLLARPTTAAALTDVLAAGSIPLPEHRAGLVGARPADQRAIAPASG